MHALCIEGACGYLEPTEGAMAEVMLTLLVEPDDAAEAFHAALEKRRWTRIEGFVSTWTCYFDAAIAEQVRRIVTSDVEHSAAEAGLTQWRGVGSLAAVETQVIEAGPIADSNRPSREVWADGAEPVGPLGEVVVSFAERAPGLTEALAARGWVRLADLPATWMHPFDLGIFEPVEAIVADELRLAANVAGLERWQAAWALATWGHVGIAMREQEPPGPYADWRW